MENERKYNRFLYSFSDNKELIYPILLYVAGLIIGTALFKYSKDGTATEIFKNVININTDNFVTLFFNRFSIYISVFVVTVFLGTCIIGFPFIYFVPLITGTVIAFKVAFFYFNYKTKGIGYSLLLILPEAAALETVIIITIEKAATLSRLIFKEAINKTEMTEDINLKSFLKSFLIYFLIVSLISLINALLIYLLSGLISL